MLKIAICDDQSADRNQIKAGVDKFLCEKEISAEVRVYDHPDKLISDCEKFMPHIYILDIVMPMITGIEAARELRWNQPDAQIIFSTSESSYALESFDVNPLGYLVKPVKEEKLFSTLELALHRINVEEENTFTIKVKGGYQTIVVSELMYIDYRNHVVSYHLYSKEVISTSTLRIGFAEYLSQNHSGSDFVQCHESIAVNIRAIDKLSKTEILVRNGEIIPVSKSRQAEVMSKYMSYQLD